jgi:hypothetical protein
MKEQKVRRGPKNIMQNPVYKNIQLEKETLEDLERLSEENGASINGLIRQVLTDYVFEQKKAK